MWIATHCTSMFRFHRFRFTWITGKLHLADDICVLNFADDLDYWCIDEVSALPTRTTRPTHPPTSQPCHTYRSCHTLRAAPHSSMHSSRAPHTFIRWGWGESSSAHRLIRFDSIRIGSVRLIVQNCEQLLRRSPDDTLSDWTDGRTDALHTGSWGPHSAPILHSTSDDRLYTAEQCGTAEQPVESS